MNSRFLDHPRDRMIGAAVAGMRASGLSGAGISQVIAASGAPKGSLYHYFPGGKLQLAREALERFGEQRRQELDTVLAGDAPADQKIKRFFARAAKGLALEDFRYGCAVAGVALDLDQEAGDLGILCNTLLESWAQTVAGALEPLPAARRHVLGRFAVSTFQGALVQVRAARNVQPVLEAGELLASLIRAELSISKG